MYTVNYIYSSHMYDSMRQVRVCLDFPMLIWVEHALIKMVVTKDCLDKWNMQLCSSCTSSLMFVDNVLKTCQLAL